MADLVGSVRTANGDVGAYSTLMEEMLEKGDQDVKNKVVKKVIEDTINKKLEASIVLQQMTEWGNSEIYFAMVLAMDPDRGSMNMVIEALETRTHKFLAILNNFLVTLRDIVNVVVVGSGELGEVNEMVKNDANKLKNL